MDGNFDDLRDEVWSKADCFIWLNYSFLTVLFRVVTRNLGWWLTQKEIWSGNRMTLKHAIGGIRHAMKSYWKKKRDYHGWLREHREKEILIFSASRQAKRWLRDKSKSI
jgi:DNA modification methylase